MFKMYDLNLKEIPFPDGVMPLDIFVGSISKTRETESIPGRNGVMNYGFNYDSRPVRITLLAEGEDRVDYRLIRNEVYELFDLHDVFYLEETDVPSRVLKVTIDESYQPDRLTRDDALFDINLRTLDSVFWESKYTTLELHDSGYDATAEKYGLVDNIDDEKASYRFTPEILTQNIGANAFKNGFLSSTTGQESSSSTNLIITSYLNVVTGNTYEFVDEGWSSAIQYWWIYEYDESNKFIKSHSFSNKQFNFVPEGKKLKFMAQPYNDNTLKASDVGVSGSGRSIIPLLRRPSTVNSFTVYNAGNVTVEPENMYIYITLGLVTTDGSLKLTNKTTGETFAFNKAVTNRNIYLDGMNIMEGTAINALRNTNRQRIRLVPGVNNFEITGATFSQITVSFKFYYR